MLLLRRTSSTGLQLQTSCDHAVVDKHCSPIVVTIISSLCHGNLKWWGVGTGGDGPEARNPRDTPLEGEVARVVLPWHPAFAGMQRELTQLAALFSVHLPI